jgi:hypothetical protein
MTAPFISVGSAVKGTESGILVKIICPVSAERAALNKKESSYRK